MPPETITSCPEEAQPMTRAARRVQRTHRMKDATGTGLTEQAGARLLSSNNTTVEPGPPGFWVMPDVRD